MSIQFSCDTLVLIGFCMRHADRLWDKVTSFIGGSGSDAFAVPSTYKEFYEVMEGLGPQGVGRGVHDEFIHDLFELSWALEGEPHKDPEKIIDALSVPQEEKNRLHRWFVASRIDRTKDQPPGPAIRQELREFDHQYEINKNGLEHLFPIRYPTDLDEVERIYRALQKEWAGGGAWDWDCRIFSESHEIACREDLQFVTEDLGHFGKRKRRLLELTKIRDIIDLEGNPL